MKSKLPVIHASSNGTQLRYRQSKGGPRRVAEQRSCRHCLSGIASNQGMLYSSDTTPLVVATDHCFAMLDLSMQLRRYKACDGPLDATRCTVEEGPSAAAFAHLQNSTVLCR